MRAPTGRVERETARIPVAEGVVLDVTTMPGHGVPFVLVHGLASNARMWDGVADRLAQRGHGSAAVDQRGHGRSDKPDRGYDFRTVTDDLAAVIAAVGYERPVVVGQSWGGNVAVELAWRFPRLVRGIACVDGGFIELAARYPTWEECRAAMTPPPLAGTASAELEARVRAGHPDWPETGIAGTLACFERFPDGTAAPWLTLERHLLILHALWEDRPSDRFPQLDVPVLLVAASTGDGTGTGASRDEIEALAATLPAGRLVWITGDHDLHAQHPVEVADLLADHLANGFWS